MSYSRRGTILGALGSFVASMLYAGVSALILALLGVRNEYLVYGYTGVLALLYYFLLWVLIVFLYAIPIGILPSLLIGTFTGWLVGQLLSWRSVESRQVARRLGFHVCLAIGLLLHLIAGIALWQNKDIGLDGLLFLYLYVLGVPTLIYLVTGSFIAGRLYDERTGKAVLLHPTAVKV